MTKVINLFGGPGAGKSTTAASLFALMKTHGEKVELVTEFAKELVYANSASDLDNQLFVLGEQDRRLRRLVGQVDFIITDSPLLLSAIYAKGPYDSPWLGSAAYGVFRSYDNINVRVLRGKRPYQSYGRVHDEEEARVIDDKIDLLLNNLPVFLAVEGDEWAAPTIYNCLKGNKLR